MYCIYSREDMKLRERIPHTWTSYNENYLKSIFDSASYCVVILTMTPHWSGLEWRHVILQLWLFFNFTKHATPIAGEVSISSLAFEVKLIENSHCQNSAILHSSEDAATDKTGSIEQYRPLRSMYIILHQ